MSRIIQVAGNVATPGAARIIRMPGVGGYAAGFFPANVDQAAAAAISSLPSVAGTVPTTQTELGTATSSVVMGTANGYRHLYSPGPCTRRAPAGTPHRPMIVARVFKANAAVAAFAGLSGTIASRNASSHYQRVSSVSAAPLVNHEGWMHAIAEKAATAVNDDAAKRMVEYWVTTRPSSPPGPPTRG